MRKTLSTVDDVLDELGGTLAVSRMLGLKKMQPVSNWRKRKRLPAHTFLTLQAELAKRDLNAPASLWGIKDEAAA